MHNSNFGKKPSRKSYYILGKVARFISLKCIPYIAKTSLTPNSLTFISFLFAILSAMLFSFNSYKTDLLAAFSYFVFFVIDHMDGDLSRYKGLESTLGSLFDHICGKVAIVFVYLGIGIGLSKQCDLYTVWIIMFMIISGFFGAQSLIFKRKLIAYEEDDNNNKFNAKKQFTTHDSLTRIFFKEVTSLHMMSIYLIVLGGLSNHVFISMVMSAFYVWAYYIFQIYTTTKYFKSLEQKG